MEANKFLLDVATYYANHPDIDLRNTLMIFPNKRSAMFMRRYLKTAYKHRTTPTYLPTLMTASAFLASFTDYDETGLAELMFILYSVYLKVARSHGVEEPLTFDRFIYWGDLILNDFDEIDNQLVDAKKLYNNLFRQKDINSNYLTEEQQEVVEYIWGSRIEQDDQYLWKPKADENDNSELKHKFLQIWQVLDELYDGFRAELKRLSDQANETLDIKRPLMAYRGMINRAAAERICQLSAEEIGYSRVIAIGFDSVSGALDRVFIHLKKLGMIDFFWDTLSYIANDCPRLVKARATRQVEQLAKAFPQPEDFDTIIAEHRDNDSAKTEIAVISVPSKYAETKVAAQIVEKWKADDMSQLPADASQKEKYIVERNPDNTAVVMPDASLLLPLVSAIPRSINSINVTMGVSLRMTPFASLVRSIISMILRDQEAGDAHLFFYEDVVNVVSNQTLQAIAAPACKAIVQYIRREKLYNVEAEVIQNLCVDPKTDDRSIAFIFEPIKNSNDPAEVGSYFHRLTQGLKELIQRVTNPNADSKSFEEVVLDVYSKAMDEVTELAKRYNTYMADKTFVILMERLVSLYKVPLSGIPIRGLQIMGLLETRSIDFDNIIVISMNERIFPRRNYMKTFIPITLRHDFGLATPEDIEAQYAYHFFHMLNRARRAVLIYDGRSRDFGGSEHSRYIAQLKYLYPEDRIRFIALGGADDQDNEDNKSIVKTEELIIDKRTPTVKAQLEAFIAGKGTRNLSISALKQYRKCPLMFYMQTVARLNDSDDPKNYIQANTIGSIIHNILEELYLPKIANPDYDSTKNDRFVEERIPDKRYRHRLIDENQIDAMIRQIKNGNKILYTIDEFQYKGKYKDNLQLMPAEAFVLERVISRVITDLLEREKERIREQGPYTFVDAEMSIRRPWKVDDKLTINFKLIIDRVDQFADKRLRFVDYKTGQDKPVVEKDLENLFSQIQNDKPNDGVLQLLAYGCVYSDMVEDFCEITPELICMHEMYSNKKFYQVTCKEGQIIYQRDIEDPAHNIKTFDEKTGEWRYSDFDFDGRFKEMVKEIFTPDIPFTQTADVNNCKYCSMNAICGREIPKDKFY